MEAYVPRRRPYPRPGSAVVMVLAWLIFTSACIGMLAFVPFGFQLSVYSLPVALIQATACVALLKWAKSLNHVSWREFLPFTPVPWRAWPAMILATLSMHFVVVAGAGLLTGNFPIPDQPTREWDFFVEVWVETILPLAIPFTIAAVSEELFFRGVILRGLLAYQSRALAVFFSAVLFAVVHLNLRQLPVAFAGGLLFGWWYAKSRSLWPAIVGHVLNNLTALFAPFVLFALAGRFASSDRDDPSGFLWATLALSLAVLAASVWWCHRSVPETSAPDSAGDPATPPPATVAPAPSVGTTGSG